MKSIHLPTIFLSIFGAAIICTLFLGFNYLEAQWSGAPATPPNGNVAAPIHTGGGYQEKAGGSVPTATDRIATGQFIAGDMMRSNRYCDVNGNNCFGPGDVGGGGGSCTLQTTVVDRCNYPTASQLNNICPSGYSLTGSTVDTSTGGCKENRYFFHCARIQCSDSTPSGSSCDATTEFLPSTSDATSYIGCTYSLPSGGHSEVTVNNGDRGFSSTFQCNDGTWQVIYNNCSFSPGP